MDESDRNGEKGWIRKTGEEQRVGKNKTGEESKGEMHDMKEWNLAGGCM